MERSGTYLEAISDQHRTEGEKKRLDGYEQPKPVYYSIAATIVPVAALWKIPSERSLEFGSFISRSGTAGKLPVSGNSDAATLILATGPIGRDSLRKTMPIAPTVAPRS